MYLSRKNNSAGYHVPESPYTRVYVFWIYNERLVVDRDTLVHALPALRLFRLVACCSDNCTLVVRSVELSQVVKFFSFSIPTDK